MDPNKATIAILHTTPATLNLVSRLIHERAPGAVVHNYLDDSILPAINAAGHISFKVEQRITGLMRQADLADPTILMSACSSIGQMVVERSETVRCPVLRIDQAAAEQIAGSEEHVTVLATLQSTLEPTRKLLETEAARADRGLTVDAHVIEGAGEALNKGDEERYIELVLAAVNSALKQPGPVLLAQASMAGVIQQVDETLRGRVLTSPVSGVDYLIEAIRQMD